VKWIDRSVMERSPWRRVGAWSWLFMAVLIAMGLKAVLLAAGAFPFNSDEAIVALMARHILLGERPVFFYGQAYMGSLDAFLVAAGFHAFGEQVWVVRAIQSALYLGTLLTTAMLGWVVFSDHRVGLVAAWLMAIPVVNVTLYTTISLGGYGEMLLIGNLILLVGLAIARDPWRNGIHNDALCLILGLLSGLGLWAFGLTLVFSLPAIGYVIWMSWRKAGGDPAPGNLAASKWSCAIRRVGLLAFGGLAGSAPWWGYARVAGLQALFGELGGSAIAGVEGMTWPAQIVQHTVNLALFGSTVLTGMRPPWGIEWLALPLMPLALAIWLGALVWSSRRFLPARLIIEAPPLFSTGQVPCQGEPIPDKPPASNPPDRSPDRRPGEWLLAGVGLTLAIGFILSPFGADPSGRYFLPLAVILALFVARAVVDWRQRWGWWAYGLVGLILVFNLWGTAQLAWRTPPGLSTQIDISTQIDRRYDAALIEFLLANGETRGYTNYWVTYPLAFLSQEELIFQPRLPYHLDFRHTARDDRYAPYAQQVAYAERVAYVTARHPPLDERLRQGLDDLGVGFQEVVIGDYHVFYNLSRVVTPEELGL